MIVMFSTKTKKILCGCICIVVTLLMCTLCFAKLKPKSIEYVYNKTFKYTIVCVDNVEYIFYRTGYSGVLAPHFKTNGDLYVCK